MSWLLLHLQDYKLRYQLDPLVKQEVLQKEQARVRATVGHLHTQRRMSDMCWAVRCRCALCQPRVF